MISSRANVSHAALFTSAFRSRPEPRHAITQHAALHQYFLLLVPSVTPFPREGRVFRQQPGAPKSLGLDHRIPRQTVSNCSPLPYSESATSAANPSHPSETNCP